MVVRILVVFLIACSCRPDPPQPSLQASAPTPSKAYESAKDSSGSYFARYAAKTEASAAGPNETYFAIVEDDGLFIVADSTQLDQDDSKHVPVDAAKFAAEVVSTTMPESCPPSSGPIDEALMACRIRAANTKLLGLNAKTASIAAVALRGNKALVGFAGDVTVLWIHDGVTEVVSSTANSSPIGASPTSSFGLRWVDMGPSDTIAIVNRGLFDHVGKARIQELIPSGPSETKELDDSMTLLIDEAKMVPHHVALSAIFVKLLQRKVDGK